MLSLLVYIRDISYSWSLKQYGYKHINYDYKFKFIGFFSGYYIAISCLVIQMLDGVFLVGFSNFISSAPVVYKLIFGILFFILPLWYIGENLLKKISHIPIKLTPVEKVLRALPKFWIGFIIGWIFTGIFGIVFPKYFKSTKGKVENVRVWGND